MLLVVNVVVEFLVIRAEVFVDTEFLRFQELKLDLVDSVLGFPKHNCLGWLINVKLLNFLPIGTQSESSFIWILTCLVTMMQ